MKKSIDLNFSAEYDDRGGSFTVRRNGRMQSGKLDASGKDATGRTVAQILAEELSRFNEDRRAKPRKEKRG